ncbi:MAG: hypothetical protein IKB68_03415 [Rikenellaceae bacterium]|nr:hypothetical protein [Rikenellaceae bacterium]
MKVLYVTATCLTKNTSANMSHNGYVQGLLENDADLDIIMASDSWGEADNKLKRWESVRYFEYESVSVADKLRDRIKKFIPSPPIAPAVTSTPAQPESQNNAKSRFSIRSLAKKVFYTIFKPDPVYPLNATWLKNASKFVSNVEYDLVVSNSSPSASHKLVGILAENGQISFKRWVQIWEDPWYHDLYGGHSEQIKQEEHNLLRVGQEIYYVSPLTTHYQKKFFADCADKMNSIPLPFLAFGEDKGGIDSEISFGYFGDYYSHTRNLQPFYDAIRTTKSKCYIYGDSDLNLISQNKIVVSGRVTLDKLEKVQNQTSILVHLCNLRGGQIPGKIYHYSATTKPILFILDGTDEEKQIIKEFFAKYNRYYFCDNNQQDIERAITDLIQNYDQNRGHIVEEFCPKKVVAQLFQ